MAFYIAVIKPLTFNELAVNLPETSKTLLLRPQTLTDEDVQMCPEMLKTRLDCPQNLTCVNTDNITRMLITNLMNKFSEEAQYLEGRQDSVSPDVNGRKANTVIIPAKFKDDIKALEDYAGRKLENGVCIKVELSELLDIVPRERRRIDAYNALVQFMKDELGVDLVISSSRKKGGCYEK